VRFYARLVAKKIQQESAILAITRVCAAARWLDAHKR
jgi:hypothetical protein